MGCQSKTQSLPRRAAEALAAKADTLSALRVIIGLDGFVDEIISVVDKRESAERFSRLPTLAALGQRIARAAGQSTNIELVVERIKLGGNGPIMANAMAALGTRVTYIGNLGYPTVHPVFGELCRRATVHSFAEAAHTDALEFEDGKLMLGKHAALRDVTWNNLVERVGRETLRTAFAEAQFVGLQNWTMLPHMSDIWQHVLEEICPCLPAEPRRLFFFDLADPEKRDPGDLRHALELIGGFQKYFDTVLGLNEKEALAVGAVLGRPGPHDGPEALAALARFVQERLQISTVVVHPRAYAVTVAADGVHRVDGPFVAKPLISTGAGDHFNAGFCLGKLIGAANEVALQIGVGASGYYVRTAQSPSAADLAEFLRKL